MKIPEFGTLQMNRTHPAHVGTSEIKNVNKVPLNDINVQSQQTSKVTFEDYLLDAMNSMNTQQVDVANLQQQIITDPESVDIHDVTIAMSKARSSLNLAQTVIDRLVKGWSEITTTR